ncbi:MAG: alanine racemase, partial [Pseudohongiellaceae bacterium]
MSFSPNPRAWAQIDLQALHGNLQRARELHPDKSIVAVIKANAYGHGMTEIAASLKQNPDGAEVLAVATMDEVIALQLQGTGKRLLLLGGFRNADELRFLLEAGIEFVIHADYQLALLKSRIRDNPRSRFSVWLKADTGMHRLGMTAEEIAAALEFLVACSQTSRVIVMSHLACVDSDDPDAAAVTALQVSRFQDIVAAARQLQDKRIEFSLSASAGILARTDLGFDYIRPGIMLYGGSPFAD